MLAENRLAHYITGKSLVFSIRHASPLTATFWRLVSQAAQLRLTSESWPQPSTICTGQGRPRRGCSDTEQVI